MKTAFICVNYNNSKVTRDYILNVLGFKDTHDIKIIIVDNASRKEDVNNLEQFIDALNIDAVVLIKSDVNLGYFKGLNLGIKLAIENNYNDYVIVGNNDLEFASNFLSELYKIPFTSNELVVAPDVVTIEGIHENPHVINKMSFLRKMKQEIYFSNYNLAKLINRFYSTDRKPKSFDPERKYIYMGIGALYVLTPNFFKHFNKLWDDVFLYGEEAILAGQIQSVNGKIIYEPLLKCNHNESATTSKMESKYKYDTIKKSYKIYKKYL